MKLKEIGARSICASNGSPTFEIITRVGRQTGQASSAAGRPPFGFQPGETFRQTEAAVDWINRTIAPALIKLGSLDQAGMDKQLVRLQKEQADGGGRLPDNAIFAISLAFARGCAAAQRISLREYLAKQDQCPGTSLPLPAVRIFDENEQVGAIGLLARNILLIPQGAKSFQQAQQMLAETLYKLNNVLKAERKGKRGGEGFVFSDLTTVSIGDRTFEAMNLIQRAIRVAGYEKSMSLGFIGRADQDWSGQDNYYTRTGRDKGNELVDIYKNMTKQFPIVSFENCLGADDRKNWELMRGKLGSDIQLVTRFSLDGKIIQPGLADAVVIESNEAKTVSGIISGARAARDHDLSLILAREPGGTEDSAFADLAVGVGVNQIKTPMLFGTETTAIYNQMTRIQAELGERAFYVGATALPSSKNR